ncbi:hypothetical protein [Elioraea sp.]|uniref:hypothetical protein n=1 Tax=Elioraea sp. TaxID=2185103 RepID=UPI0021DC222A|nr:hypothetical protein [Elioraea sp.]GIX12034.1 MAG: hypothetical protein KatS3mg116_3744 [Elioraea sp.]
MSDRRPPALAVRPRRWLPALLREVAERCGEAAALRLAEAWGGRYLHVPRRVSPDHPVARDVGLDVLAYLVEAYGDLGRIVVPLGPAARGARGEQIAPLVEVGATANEIAARTGLHVRDVHRWRRRLRAGRGADPA